MSKLYRRGDELILVYAVTKPIDGWLDDVDGIRQLKDGSFELFLSDHYKDLYKISSLYRPSYASRYSIVHSNLNLISCTPDDQFEVNTMHLPTLAGLEPDLIDKIIDLTVPFYPVLPYVNMHRCRLRLTRRIWA
jgi:hypothetical protein